MEEMNRAGARFRSALYGGWFGFLPAVKRFLAETVYPEEAVCRACGRIVKDGCLCAECREHLRTDGTVYAWNEERLGDGEITAWSLRPHAGVARQLVLRLKHQAERCVAAELADLVLPAPAEFQPAEGTVVTWVPMPESRRRERCIDHGREIAEAVADRLGLPCRQLLNRMETKEKPQAKLNREERQANLARAFRPAERIDFPVLLTDDVLTTGTTALRCAEALRAGGAKNITVLTITRAMPGYMTGKG